MKIKVTKKKNSVSIRFRAESDQEGVDLKDAVMSSGNRGASPGPWVEELRRRGYKGGVTKETRSTKEFTLSRKNDGQEE